MYFTSSDHCWRLSKGTICKVSSARGRSLKQRLNDALISRNNGLHDYSRLIGIQIVDECIQIVAHMSKGPFTPRTITYKDSDNDKDIVLTIILNIKE